MQTRRDRLQAYRFGTRRSVAALLAGDPDAPEAPLRRVAGAVLAGVLIGALVVAVAGIYGALSPGGSKSWRGGKSLIVEKETNTRYVYVAGVLHPALNYASARLVLGQGDPPVARVARASLGDTPRGLPVGIPGAPDALPSAKSLLTGRWTACAEPARTPAGAAVPYTRVWVGGAPAGMVAVPSDGALLVGGLDGTRYLVWRGYRLRIASDVVLPALSWSASQLLPVGAAWLNAVPSGPDLAPPDVPGRGAPGPSVAGNPTLVGQVLLVSNVDTENGYYVVRADGLSPVSALQAALLLGDPATRQAYPSGAVGPVTVSAAAAAAVPRSATGVTAPADYPTRAPRLVDAAPGSAAVCAQVTGDGVRLSTVVEQASTVDSPVLVDPVGGVPVADEVTVAPGHGALVRAVPAPGVTTGTAYLVTDLGYKFPLVGTAAQTSLGYPGTTPVPVPSGLLQALPTGPALDPAAAGVTVGP